MKQKIFMLAISLLGFVVAKANDDGPGPGDGKKDDLNGTGHSFGNQKTIEGCKCTAYLISKKEKMV